MKKLSEKKIFSACTSREFIGRRAELERLLRHAHGEGNSNGLVLLSAPSSGSSELLRQTYDRLFARESEVIPFYFEIKAGDGTPRNIGLRFVREFLLQTVAFRRRDARVLDSSPEIHEIAKWAPASDAYWIDRMIKTFLGESKLDDAANV